MRLVTRSRQRDTAAIVRGLPACSIWSPVRYYVTLDADRNAEPVVVDLIELPGGSLEAKIHSRSVDLDVAMVGAQLSVRVDGQVVDLTTAGVPPEIEAVADGHRSLVRVESERMRAADQAKETTVAAGERSVKAPMPGRVVKVLVVQGDSVQPGQGLVVLEAMKMENEVRARAAGTVAVVHVTAGATVEGNAKLVTMA
jgi:biotin carboxyl carrier protein